MMNERIAELIEQAQVNDTNRPGRYFDKEKFALLVMAECAKACADEQCNTLYSPKEMIDMHFGVSE